MVAHNSIMTQDNLRRRGFIGPSLCVMCHQEEESINHLLFECSNAKTIWKQQYFSFKQTERLPRNGNNLWDYWSHNIFKYKIVKPTWNSGMVFIWWQLWLEQNNRIFKIEFGLEEKTWSFIIKNYWKVCKLKYKKNLRW